MAKYYYLVASFPDLDLERGNKNIDFEEIIDRIKRNLSEEDLALFQYLLYPTDIKNIISEIAAKREKPSLYPTFYLPTHIERGSFKNTAKILENLPEFLYKLFAQHPEWLEDKKLVKLENTMLERFYHAVAKQKDLFIRKYFVFDRDLRNILVACNARRYKFSLQPYLIGNAEINRQLLRSQDNDFGLSQQYPFIDTVFQTLEREEPVAIEELLDRLRWNFIDEYNAFNFFERSNVFGYFLKLMIVKRWVDLEVEEESHYLEALINNGMENFEIPEVFS